MNAGSVRGAKIQGVPCGAMAPSEASSAPSVSAMRVSAAGQRSNEAAAA